MTSETEQVIAQALRGQIPLKGLPGVSIQNVREQPEQPFDISFELLSGPNRILVLGEIKSTFSPRLLEEIGPWIRRLKSLRPTFRSPLLRHCYRPRPKHSVFRMELTSST